jgi:hypothetical protein
MAKVKEETTEGKGRQRWGLDCLSFIRGGLGECAFQPLWSSRAGLLAFFDGYFRNNRYPHQTSTHSKRYNCPGTPQQQQKKRASEKAVRKRQTLDPTAT